MSAILKLTDVEQLAQGPLSQAFMFGFAAWPGAVLAVPLAVLAGDFKRLQDALPISSEEALDVIDKPRAIPLQEVMDGFVPLASARFDGLATLVSQAEYECPQKGYWWVASTSSGNFRVFIHDCGIRLALAPSLLVKGRQ